MCIRDRYMADRTRLREKGYDTLRSKRYYMENMEMGSRIFDKCVETVSYTHLHFPAEHIRGSDA